MDIVEEHQLGLLLYRSVVICEFDYKVADAICKKMNFTRAEIMTRKSISYIPGIKVLGRMWPGSNIANWDYSSYKENYQNECGDSKYMYLSCTGSFRMFITEGRG